MSEKKKTLWQQIKIPVLVTVAATAVSQFGASIWNTAQAALNEDALQLFIRRIQPPKLRSGMIRLGFDIVLYNQTNRAVRAEEIRTTLQVWNDGDQAWKTLASTRPDKAANVDIQPREHHSIKATMDAPLLERAIDILPTLFDTITGGDNGFKDMIEDGKLGMKLKLLSSAKVEGILISDIKEFDT